MEFLHEKIQNYSDEYLVEQYTKYKDDYTPEALAILKDEIDKRQLEINSANKTNDKPQEIINLDRNDFICFEHDFSRTDLQLAVTILRDNDVIFFVDNPSSGDSFPLENVSTLRYTIEVHKDWVQKAHELLDEHFIKGDESYVLKYTAPKDRLKAFNFHDIHLTEGEANEELEVVFDDEEKKIILLYAAKLLEEADKIESQQERVLFYYDSIEPVTQKLESSANKLNRSDLLTILEILQVYCDEPEFPESIDETIQTLLSFFIEQ